MIFKVLRPSSGPRVLCQNRYPAQPSSKYPEWECTVVAIAKRRQIKRHSGKGHSVVDVDGIMTL